MTLRQDNITIRPLTEADLPALDDLLYEAIFVPEGVEPLPRDIIKKPEIAVYTKDFGSKKDDYCLLAEHDGKIIGGVWVRILSGDIKGFGHIDSETPEFAIALYKAYRNQGIGTQLMREMIDYLKDKGYRQCSLSVQKINYAVKLYRNLGFETVEENEEDFIMALTFQNIL